VPVNFNGSYSQNFDSLINTGTNQSWANNSTLPGWYLFRQPSPGTAITTYNADSGGSATGSFYSYGATGSSERALGGIGSGNDYFGSPSTSEVAGWIALALNNTTGATIGQINLSFDGEQWRNGGNTNPQTMVFEYGLGATFGAVSTWLTPSGNFNWASPIATSTAGSVDGNAAGLVSNRGGTLSSLSWANGNTLWLRWREVNDAGNDHGLAIDNVSINLPAPSVNHAPVLSFSSSPLSFSENAAPLQLDPAASLNDADAPTNYSGGTLTARIATGGIASDRLGFSTTASISLNGRIIRFNGTEIGTFSGGSYGPSALENLVVSLNANATPAAVTALLQAINYSNVGEDLPANSSRSLEVSLREADGTTSNIATRTIDIAGSNDAPFVGRSILLYSGSGAPSSFVGWVPLNTSSAGTPNITNGGATVNTMGNVGANFGYGMSSFTNPNLALNAIDGYVVQFNAQVNNETFAATADKNNDGKNDRAGFSVLVISSDATKAIELGFWQNRIWAQDDGTSQVNPALEPDESGNPSNFRTLFTQAESAAFDTTSARIYQLAVQGNTYTLSSGGSVILSGKLRNYTAFNKSPNPYRTPNSLYFGDNTSSASGQFTLGAVSLITNPTTLPKQTADEETAQAIAGLAVGDRDAGNAIVTVSLAVNNGQIRVNDSVPSGVSSSNITSNSSSNVTLTGSISQINTTLAALNGLTYQGNLNFAGTDTLTISVNDGGAIGGTEQIASKSISITVNNVNDAPTVATAIADQTAAEDIAFSFQIPANSFTDVDGDNLTYTATLEDGSALPKWLRFDSGTRTFSGTPAGRDIGTINIKVTANDGNNGTVSDSFALTITEPRNITTNTITGTPNRDSNLRGTNLGDSIDGLAGDDIIFGLDGNDNLYGGAGNDILRGGNGNDVVDGNRGNDTLFGEAGNDILLGDNGNDLLRGGDDDDIVKGQAGNDMLFGDAGNDTLAGGDGNDVLRGGDGNDALTGGSEGDILYGDAGDDLLNGGAGADILYGGSGSDTFVLARGKGADTIMDFADGQDRIQLQGLSYGQLTFTQSGVNTVIQAEGQVLATLNRVNKNLISAADFVASPASDELLM